MNIQESIQVKITKLRTLLENQQAVTILQQWLETELAYTSNHIEGNTLTRKETELAITQGLTSGGKPIKDYLEAKNHAEAFQYILNDLCKKTVVAEDDILKLHSMVLRGINDAFAGRYRNVPVRISGSSVILPNPMKVADLMKMFIAELPKETDVLKRAFLGHFKFVSIHPFIDGNGRVGRLLMNCILMQAGLWPVIIRPRDRKQYIRSIEKGQLSQDTSAYIDFMYKAFDRSLSNYLKMFATPQPEVELLKIGQFAKAVGVPVSTVRYWLRVGKLTPATKTATDYMLFSQEQVKQMKQ